MFKTNYKKRYCALGILLVVLLGSAGIERATLPETTDVMLVKAEQFGSTHRKETPSKPFVYDGCTFFVDSFIESDLREACFTHDVAYWYGGTKEDRKNADKKLQEDVAETGIVGLVLSYPVYIGVRIFGDSVLTKAVNAHWGFGWE